MKTLPANFAPFRMRETVTQHWILKITLGSDTYLFSNCEMELTDGHVRGLLVNPEQVATDEGVSDPITREWSVTGLDITLINTDPDFIVSDELVAMSGASVKLYCLAGNLAAALSDCLLMFDGVMVDELFFNEDTATLTAIPLGEMLLSKKTPPVTMVSTYPNAGNYRRAQLPGTISLPLLVPVHRRVPILYGQFTVDLADPTLGLGMACGLPTTTNAKPVFVFSGHKLHAITAMYLTPIGRFPLAFPDAAVDNEDADGNGSGQAGSYDYVWLLTPLVKQDATSQCLNFANVIDSDLGTYGTLQDNIRDDGVKIEGMCLFGFNDDDQKAIATVFSSNAAINQETPYQIVYKLTDLGYADTFAWRLQGINTFIDHLITSNVDGTLHTVADTEAGSQTGEIYVGIHAEGPTGSHTTGINNDNLVAIYTFGITYGLFYATVFPDGKVVGNQQVNQDFAWAQCEGREYGSWITESSRSVGGKSYGDLITDIAHIIEGLCRNEAGAATANIDIASFDAAYGDQDGRVNIVDETTVREAVLQLVQQTTCIFHWSSSGRARLTPLVWTPNVNRTIRYSHLVGNIEVSKRPFKANRLTVNNRWQGEYGIFRDRDVSNNSASQTALGQTVEEVVDWPNVTGIDADTGAATALALLVGGQTMVRFKTRGIINYDLEIGDHIGFDAESFDPQRLCYGASWSGLNFIILNLHSDQSGTEITAMEVT